MEKAAAQKRQKELINYLSRFVTEERYERFLTLLELRTRYITVALEDIYQPHNASAVLRSCDCFGVQDVHIIENKNTYSVNPQVAMGASKWLTMHRYKEKQNNTSDAINHLKKNGYKIVAMSPENNCTDIFDFDMSQKFALLFGTEMHGLSEEALAMADASVKIPMYGFTESFNISVTVALSLFYFTQKIRASDIDYQLSSEEKDEVLLLWLKKSLKDGENLVKSFLNKNT